MWDKKVKDTTFGVELEFADNDKEQLELPEGYQYTDNELTRMYNSDMSNVTHKGRYGCEINTKPYRYTQENMDHLYQFVDQIKSHGGYLIWNEGFDAHIYCKHLSLDELKRVFALSYYTSSHIKKIFDVPPWFDNKYISPVPDRETFNKLMKIENIEEIRSVFSNASHRGHIRYTINLMPLLKIGTIEFRLFNSSWEHEEINECVKFMYEYINYAVVNKNIDKYKELNSVKKCVKAFNLDPNKTPKTHYPLLWASDHNDFVTMIAESKPKNKNLMSSVVECTANFDKIFVCNSHFFDIEQALSTTGKEIVAYSKESLMLAIFEIAVNDKKIELSEEFDWIDSTEGTKAERLAKLLFWNKVRKTTGATNEYQQSEFEDYKENKDKILAKMLERCQKIVERFNTGNISFINGSVKEAIQAAKSEKSAIVVYQSEMNRKIRAGSNALDRQTKEESIRFPTLYKDVDISQVPYVVISENRFLNLRMVVRQHRMHVYSSEMKKNINNFTERKSEPIKYKLIDKDYQITRKSKIKFVDASMAEVDYLRFMYMKKDILLGSARFNYLWFIDNQLIGAVMFDLSKQARSAGDIVWMKSDFVIDTNIPKLSKLLIMAVLSKEFKQELNVRYKTEVKQITTTVFSDKSTSMKYRGVFEVDKKENSKIYYEAPAGKYKTLKAVLTLYMDKFNK